VSSTDKLFKATIAPYSAAVQKKLTQLRSLILATARETDGVGATEETLKWNQFSFLTSESASGSTIRIDGSRKEPAKLAMYVHCQSGLIDEFKQHYARTLQFEGKRAVVLDAAEPLPKDALKHCISLALTHHMRKMPRQKRKENAQGAKHGQTANHHRHRSGPG
jgi:hypothetical protein